MKTRPLPLLFAGLLISGGLLSAAGPASADPCYPPVAGCVATHGVQATAAYDASTGTITLSVGGLLPGSRVSVTISLPSSAGGAAYTGQLHIGSAVARSGTAVTFRSASLSHTWSSSVGTTGEAHLAAPVSAFGSLSTSQIQALVWTMTGTAADGTPISIRSAGSGAAAGSSSGHPSTGGSVPGGGSSSAGTSSYPVAPPVTAAPQSAAAPAPAAGQVQAPTRTVTAALPADKSGGGALPYALGGTALAVAAGALLLFFRRSRPRHGRATGS